MDLQNLTVLRIPRNTGRGTHNRRLFLPRRTGVKLVLVDVPERLYHVMAGAPSGN